mgnify:CR=1 FL=1
MKLLKKYQNQKNKVKRNYNELVATSNNKQYKILNILALPKIQYTFDVNKKYLFENIINPFSDLISKIIFLYFITGVSTQ